MQTCLQTHKWDTVISRGKKKEVASKSVFVLKAGELNGDFALSQGREEGFLWYYQAQRWEEWSTKKNCYSHQLVGVVLLKHLSKEGFGRGPLEFCHSQTLVFGMTMLAAGCTFLCEARQMKFHNSISIKWGSCCRFLLHTKEYDWCLSLSVIKAPLTWSYEVKHFHIPP